MNLFLSLNDGFSRVLMNGLLLELFERSAILVIMHAVCE
jgi:hypothetical protein